MEKENKVDWIMVLKVAIAVLSAIAATIGVTAKTKKSEAIADNADGANNKK